MTERNEPPSSAGHDPSLIVVSNRMPIRLTVDGDEWHAERSSGGLASALQGVAAETRMTWVGWPGCELNESIRGDVEAWMAESDLVPVEISDAEADLYYDGIANGVLWPLFHYFADKIEFEQAAWQAYVDVNRRFAERVIEFAERGARVWVHDFHLMLVPGLLRVARPDLEIGFFLHIPFPSSEIYRLLPTREALLEGLLGADYLGFHTHDYVRHFRASALRVLGLESTHDEIEFEGRHVGLGVHPIGVDVGGFEAALAAPAAAEHLTELHDHYRGRQVLLGVERLDYTKGVTLKLRMFERLLERRPDLHDRVVLLQLIVPSRLDNPEYAALKREIEEQVGRINGRYGSPGWTPIEYLHRSVPKEQLVALYRYADVGLVTPIRDGMNLVAQEFVLCQDEREDIDGSFRGILVISEFAGAAQVLARALLVNPWDIERTVETLEFALTMSADERESRMRTMVGQVRSLRVEHWARQFLQRMASAARRGHASNLQSKVLRGEELERIVARHRAAESRILLLDYDGTLRELVRLPEEAGPTVEILALLRDLCADPKNQVHIVSGRHRADLTAWLGHLPLHLAAEHGFASRTPGGAWISRDDVDLSWLPQIEAAIAQVCDEIPGTLLERKPCGVAWHYRVADPDYGTWRARELHSQLLDEWKSLPVEIVHGHRVIEVRAAGVDKGHYVTRVLAARASGAFVLCIGDDRTDRDMYAALPEDAISVHVGGAAETTHSIESPARVRKFLRRLIGA